jgi:hypothetical protein
VSLVRFLEAPPLKTKRLLFLEEK